MRFERLAGLAFQTRPVEAFGNVGRPVVRRLRVLVRQLQKQQVGQLLQVVAVTHAVVAQRVAEVPDFLDEGRCIHQIPIKYGAAAQIIDLYGFF